MKVVNFAQKSPEWLAWRDQGVSASDMLVVVGKSPYKTRFRLWQEKTKRYNPEDLSRNPNVARGVANEESIRVWIEAHINDVLFPSVAESVRYPFIRSSFDGVCSAGIPYEMKSPTDKGWNEVLQDGLMSDQVQKYRYQIQTQILVADSTHGYMVFCNPDASDFRMLKVERDEELIAEIIEASRDFMKHLDEDTPPPLDPDRDSFSPTVEQVPDWMRLAQDYRSADEQIKKLEEQVKLLKQFRDGAEDGLIGLMSGFGKADFGGLQLTKSLRKGTIDYERMLKVVLPDLDEATKDAYRKPGFEVWRVTVRDDAIPKNCVDESVINQISDSSAANIPAAFF